VNLGFQGKTVGITGATANIGRAIALEMAQKGAPVVADARGRGAADALFVPVDKR
jgi:NAD(P)-dependent dehydrogenase (short-subunit alcohol dehydrogenase family)